MNSKKRMLHFSIWLCYGLGVASLFMSGTSFDFGEFSFYLFIVLGQAGLFYFNADWLMPRFFQQKKYVVYFSSIAAIILIFTYSMEWSMYSDVQQDTNPSEYEEAIPFFSFQSLFVNSTPVLMALAGSFIYKLISLNRERERREHLLIEAENRFLKSQLNPHFLFNSLNNIYAMAQMKEENTSEAIFQLSEILRYILYDCNKGSVLLEKEIQYLESFIQLSMLKEEVPLNVNCNFENINSKLKIAPLILIPFVENSFKHSNIEDAQNGWIKIEGRTKNNIFYFQIQNSVPKTPQPKDQQGGIGLENIRRRLELIYPENHEFKIQKKEQFFAVQLKIALHET